jgi:hypothetical protein
LQFAAVRQPHCDRDRVRTQRGLCRQGRAAPLAFGASSCSFLLASPRLLLLASLPLRFGLASTRRLALLLFLALPLRARVGAAREGG